MGLWQVVGMLLFLWLGWDLYSGKTWLHRAIVRSEEPCLFWMSIGLWSIVALSVVVG